VVGKPQLAEIQHFARRNAAKKQKDFFGMNQYPGDFLWVSVSNQGINIPAKKFRQ
jgi:hypothetical protein